MSVQAHTLSKCSHGLQDFPGTPSTPQNPPQISENTKNIFLYVNVIIVGNAFNITAELRKVVTDQASSNIGWAATWDIGFTGTHGNIANFIISSVAQVTDKFIDEYLRVNEAACG